ncbi:MAG: hypothetical protein HY512_02270 [Candidatus Aenigmarchaeota archaeon]|nr:hypothetical protein [Candidatus Aenigmarchaeota archaeon]
MGRTYSSSVGFASGVALGILGDLDSFPLEVIVGLSAAGSAVISNRIFETYKGYERLNPVYVGLGVSTGRVVCNFLRNYV